MKTYSYLLLFTVLYTFPQAETGMCLVVDCPAFGQPGNIRRIDFENDKVINTTAKLGFGKYPRFAPDGNGFAYIDGSTVKLCDLDGNVVKSFAAPGEGKLSYTDLGIYIGLTGKIYRYSLTGSKQWEKAFPNCGDAYVSKNGVTGVSIVKAAGTDGQTTWRIAIHNLAGGTTMVAKDEQGCSGCPSPDGNLTTQNRGEGSSICHLYMRIRNKSATIVQSYSLKDLTGLDISQGWCWNTQCWSGNSNDVILLPVGKDDGQGGCRQIEFNCEPWIYNINTNRAYRLASRPNGSFWQPYDFYQGKLPAPPAPDISLSPASLEFSAIPGGSDPPNRNVTVTAVGGQSLSGMTATESAGWLQVTISGSGTSRTLTNKITTGSLGEGTHTTTVAVKAGIITKTYTVKLVVAKVYIKMNAGTNTLPGWESDGHYLTGGNAYENIKTFITTGVAQAGPMGLYQTCRNAGPAFTFNVPDAVYTVRLHFAEPHHTTLADAAKRNMTVKLEGQTVLSNFNPGVAAGACAKAYVYEKVVTVSDGNGLKAEFIDTGGDAFVMGIEVVGGGSGMFDVRHPNGGYPARPVQIQVTSNPVYNTLVFKVEGYALRGRDIRLFGSDGNPLRVTFEGPSNNNEYSCDLEGIAEGVYLLKVYTGNGVVSRKVVVAR